MQIVKDEKHEDMRGMILGHVHWRCFVCKDGNLNEDTSLTKGINLVYKRYLVWKPIFTLIHWT